MTDLLKIAVIQKPPVYLNLRETINTCCDYVKESAGNGAELIVFPETWLAGYPVWLDYSPSAALWDYDPANELYKVFYENSLEIPSKEFEDLRKFIAGLSVSVVLGVNEKSGKSIYNTMVFINEKGEYITHRKLIPTYTERLLWGRGDGSTINTIETKYGKVGGLICWEHWMPLLRAAMHSKNETVHIAQWPTVKDMHIVAGRHYAFEGRCFVISAGTVLTKGEMLEGINSLKLSGKSAAELINEIPVNDHECIMQGGSSVIAPDGSFILEPVYNKPEILYAEFDPSMVYEGANVLDTDGHYSRPDIFQLSVNTDQQINVTFTNEKKSDK